MFALNVDVILILSVCVLSASLCLMLTLFCRQKSGWPRIQRSIADITFSFSFLFTPSVSFRVRLCYAPCQDDQSRWMSLSQCASPHWTRAWTAWPCSPARSVCITLLTTIMQRGQKINFQTQRTCSTLWLFWTTSPRHTMQCATFSCLFICLVLMSLCLMSFFFPLCVTLIMPLVLCCISYYIKNKFVTQKTAKLKRRGIKIAPFNTGNFTKHLRNTTQNSMNLLWLAAGQKNAAIFLLLSLKIDCGCLLIFQVLFVTHLHE